MLRRAKELGNVSKAYRIVGYSRHQFYEIRRSFQLDGGDGLLDWLPGAKGPHPNRVPAQVEEVILAHTLEHPTHTRPSEVTDKLMLKGIQVSAAGWAGGLNPQRPPHAPPPAAAAGGDGPEAEDQADGRAARGAGAFRPQLPRAATSGSAPQANLWPSTPCRNGMSGGYRQVKCEERPPVLLGHPDEHRTRWLLLSPLKQCEPVRPSHAAGIGDADLPSRIVERQARRRTNPNKDVGVHGRHHEHLSEWS